MPAIRLRIVTQKIVQASEDRARCGPRCQFLHGVCCWLDGIDELEVDSERAPMRSEQCLEAEQNDS